MTVTVTLHLWWLWAYLGVGVVTFLPIDYLAYRQVPAWRERGYWTTFVDQLTRRVYTNPKPRRAVRRVLIQVVAWPLAAWEVIPRRWFK